MTQTGKFSRTHDYGDMETQHVSQCYQRVHVQAQKISLNLVL